MEKQLTLITHGLVCPSSIAIFEKMFCLGWNIPNFF